MSQIDHTAMIASVVAIAFILLCFIYIAIREHHIKREEQMKRRIEQSIQAKVERRLEEEQTERERFQKESIAVSRDAWKAVQEMVSTARDLAYLEQREK